MHLFHFNVKTAVCAGNGTWLPQVSCGEDDRITEVGNHYINYAPIGVANTIVIRQEPFYGLDCNYIIVLCVIILQVRLLVIPHLHVLVVLLVQQCW